MPDFVNAEIIDALVYQMRQNRVTFRLGEEVKLLDIYDGPKGMKVRIDLESGKQIITDKALYSIGRTGATGDLNLPAAGLSADERGRLTVNANYQTSSPHFCAVGDVIGFLSLASTSMEQGRLAACDAFGAEGKNEEQLTADGVPYEAGHAFYREIARGQIIGDSTGILKLMFHRETR